MSYLGLCTMLFQERTGAKQPLIKRNWKLGGQSSGDEPIPQMWCVAAGREERRCCSAIVCPVTAMQDPRRRTSSARIENWLKKKLRVCVVFCTKPVPYHRPNSAERNNSEITTTSPRRNLGKKKKITESQNVRGWKGPLWVI